MNRLLLTIFLGFVITFPLTSQTAFGGISFDKPTFTSQNGKVTVDPVVGLSPNGFTLHYQDVVTVTRDTSMDCEEISSPGSFVTPTSVFLNAGPFSDQFGEGGGDLAEFLLQPAFALDQGMPINQQMFPTVNPYVQTQIGPIIPSHGSGPMSFTINCPAGSTQTNIDSFFDIFVDPSGLVLDACTGAPIAGAVVKLTVDDDSNSIFTDPDDSIIDPDFNPQFTFLDGSYGWDVAPFGFDWLVTVTSAAGYQVPVSLGPYTISGPGDAVTDANFFLQPIDQSCAIGGTLLPVDSTALLLAGAQTSALWILPAVIAGAGFAALKLRKHN